MNPYLQVLSVEFGWIQPMLKKIESLDAERLMGQKLPAGALAKRKHDQASVAVKLQRRNDESSVEAARARFLARRKGV